MECSYSACHQADPHNTEKSFGTMKIWWSRLRIQLDLNSYFYSNAIKIIVLTKNYTRDESLPLNYVQTENSLIFGLKTKGRLEDSVVGKAWEMLLLEGKNTVVGYIYIQKAN